MTARLVIDSHVDLTDVSGTITHQQIDNVLTGSGFIAVSGSANPLAASARNLKAGSGITLTDNGPGNDLVIASTATGTGSLPSPTQYGQVIFAATTDKFSPSLPITSPSTGWLLNDQGYLLVSASL